MHWGILTLSLLVSVALAFIFVKLIIFVGLKEQLAMVVPLLPIFYGLIFPALERTVARPADGLKAGRFYYSPERWRSSLRVVLIATLVSILAQTVMDAGAWFINRRFVLHQPVPALPQAGISPFLNLLQGNLLPLQGAWKIFYLTLQMLVVSLIGGICAGILSRFNPLMNGLLSGVLVSVWMGTNQFSVLYEELTLISVHVTTRFGLHNRWSNGVLTGLFLQVFLFALVSGIASRYQFADPDLRHKFRKF